jgi:hypothetical protein
VISSGTLKGAADRADFDDDSSDGASLEEDEQTLNVASAGLQSLPSVASLTGGAGGRSVSMIDNLSGLFSMINGVCQEQFEIIRKVFPSHTVARVTRALVQRIFNDPAFGIQHRVDEVLRPPEPLPPLPLPEYLDALLTIREKLSALYLLLVECCSHEAYRGMGSDSAALRRAKQSHIPSSLTRNQPSSAQGGRIGNDDVRHGYGGASSSLIAVSSYGHMRDSSGVDAEDLKEEAGELAAGRMDGEDGEGDDNDVEERLRSDTEIQEFFQDQVGLFLDCFAKICCSVVSDQL